MPVKLFWPCWQSNVACLNRLASSPVPTFPADALPTSSYCAEGLGLGLGLGLLALYEVHIYTLGNEQRRFINHYLPISNLALVFDSSPNCRLGILATFD
ncbi:unnamed protein product [Penicillium roqueforti FM164]|uniref:Uncharacterized protein n=1 Tax=Penicillium roqueforti (strain FM164) TaxID=1365484 RepID=W6QJ81_PENRF|nr:unnamed protein product [Penicillium roqueforti FM164]